MAVSMDLVKQLKEKTGAGLMDCKKALEETGGDIEKAIKILREKGFASAEKKAERETKEGYVYIDIKGNEGIIIEVDCETDFVSRNEEFKNFVRELANVIFSKKILSVNDEVENLRKEAVMKFGENIVVKRWEIFKLSEGNVF